MQNKNYLDLRDLKKLPQGTMFYWTSRDRSSDSEPGGDAMTVLLLCVVANQLCEVQCAESRYFNDASTDFVGFYLVAQDCCNEGISKANKPAFTVITGGHANEEIEDDDVNDTWLWENAGRVVTEDLGMLAHKDKTWFNHRRL
jgi:hypothetical protein